VIGERFRRQIHRILDGAAETTTESHGGGYGSSLTRAPYPSAPRPGRIPAGIRFGRLRFHSPDGTQWSPDLLREVLGPPVQHPDRPESFAGVAVGPDGLCCWVADVSARTVSVLPPVPAASAGGETPLAWAGASLAVAVPAPTETSADVRHVFEAAPGQRIRLTPRTPATDHPPSAIVLLTPPRPTATIRPTVLRARPYGRVRGAPTGHIAACGDDIDIAVAGPASCEEHLVKPDGRVLEFQWSTMRRAAHLVLVTETADGFAVTSFAASGGGIGPANVLHRHDGRYLHAHAGRRLFILTLNGDGSYAVIIVDPAEPRPAVRILALPLALPTILKIAAVRGHTFATVDTGNRVVVWHAPPDALAVRRSYERILPADEELVTIAGRRDPFKFVVKNRTAHAPLPAHPGGAPVVSGQVADAAAEFTLHLPEDSAPAAYLVWLSQRAEPLPDGAAASALDPYWLTLAGFAVLDVRMTPAWWPEVPDEEIRPRLIRQIRGAVEGSGIAREGDRLAVGGTSFGATLALVAIADCELFRTAIVQSGAYARQLTPLGFQDETRTLWEAPRVYRDFDAVVNAPRIRKPVLIIHGEADENPATPLVQATLLFQALVANGTRSRLVVLSGEGHAPLTCDGIAAALAEKAGWLHSCCVPQ
jgi:hypothetical protein